MSMLSVTSASMRNDNNNDPTKKNLVAYFTKRDLILYALGIGCCSGGEYNEQDELRYVYERHPSFEMFPTFLLSLNFTAESESNTPNSQMMGIRPSPPESMRISEHEPGIIPKAFLNTTSVEELGNLPILHMSQSLVFHHTTDKIVFSNNNNNNDSPDNPVKVNLQTEIVSLRPRQIGTFVTSETKYYYRDYCIATGEMTALVYGLSPNKVLPWQRTPTKNNSCNNNVPKISVTEKKKTVYKVTIPSHATLLYRLNGDYNPIHVEGTSGDDQGAILHGLCTLGYATRIILRHVKTMTEKSDDVRLTAIRCNFVKPVYIGDILHIEVWDPIICNATIDGNRSINFRVLRVASKVTVVDKGGAEFQAKVGSKL